MAACPVAVASAAGGMPKNRVASASVKVASGSASQQYGSSRLTDSRPLAVFTQYVPATMDAGRMRAALPVVVLAAILTFWGEVAVPSVASLASLALLAYLARRAKSDTICAVLPHLLCKQVCASERTPRPQLSTGGAETPTIQLPRRP